MTLRTIFFNQEEPPRDRMLRLLVFILTTAFLYGKSVGFEFLPTWDDSKYLLNNYAVQSWSLENLSTIFSSTVLGNYAPLHLVLYAAEHSLWGLNPAGYHLSNIILHALNACLAYVIIFSISKDRRVAFSAALLFCIHPINVENVAWVSESKTLLATFWAFLALLLYTRFRKDGRRSLFYWAIICFIAGMLTKASVVTLPLVFLAYEWYIAPHPRNWRGLIPFFSFSLVGGILAVWAQMLGHAVPGEILTLDSLFYNVYPTMITVMWKYIGLMLWPTNLCGYYDTTLYHSFFDIPVIASLASWMLVFIILFKKAPPHVRFWFCWYWTFLLPASNIVPLPVYYADRYLYLSGLGMFVLAVTTIHALVGKMKRGKELASFIMIILIGFFSITAFNRLDVWRNETVFWEDTVKKSPHLYKSNLNLAVAYEKAGRYDDAEKLYRSALSVRPDGDEARYNLQMILIKKEYGKLRETR